MFYKEFGKDIHRKHNSKKGVSYSYCYFLEISVIKFKGYLRHKTDVSFEAQVNKIYIL